MREFEADLPVGVGVYEALRRDIVFGRLRSSQKLKLDPLRRDYGASIATLREALNRLASEGFVRPKGSVVSLWRTCRVTACARSLTCGSCWNVMRFTCLSKLATW